MKKIIRYEIAQIYPKQFVSEERTLAEAVNDWMKKGGWQPLGAPYVNNTDQKNPSLCQAMVIYKEQSQ